MAQSNQSPTIKKAARMGGLRVRYLCCKYPGNKPVVRLQGCENLYQSPELWSVVYQQDNQRARAMRAHLQALLDIGTAGRAGDHVDGARHFFAMYRP